MYFRSPGNFIPRKFSCHRAVGPERLHLMLAFRGFQTPARTGTVPNDPRLSGEYRLRKLLGAACATLSFAAVLGAAAAQPAQTPTFTDLYNFTGAGDGGQPLAGLLRDAAGNLYGTTYSGGASGFGVVFKLNRRGTETVLHSFAGGADGEYPYSELVLDADGDLYGTAAGGGGTGCGGFGCGVVFEVDASDTLTVLHSFSGGAADGCYPYGTPVIDSKSNLYGTAEKCGASGYGIVWKLNQKKGVFSILHSFTGESSDGRYPVAGVLIGAKGNLIGNTVAGGADDIGTVYELNSKHRITLLHSFAGPEGEYPSGNLIGDEKGNLYGIAEEGGSGGAGTVWKLTR
jgi:uncharacterized repeat protein (TIGR03803 family)